LRPRAGRCSLFGPRCSRPSPRPALARPPAARAPARASPGRGGADEARRDDRLCGLHAERRRERGGRRRVRSRDRPAWRGVAPVRAPQATGVCAHEARPRPYERLLHRDASRMIGAAALVAVPLLAVFPYRRAGLGWGRAAALAVLAVVLSAAGAAVFALYVYVVEVGAALCGSTPVWAGAAAVAAYLVVASWAALRPRRFWAWPLAFGAAAA